MGCLIRGCLNLTETAKVGIPKPRIPRSGIPKTGIPKPGTPKTGIPKTGIPKVGKTHNWDSPRDRESREEKAITHHAFFPKIFRKIGQKSKQQKTHISVAKCVRCFKDPARLRLARPISCIFSVGRVHHESLHGGCPEKFHFPPGKLFPFSHRKMVCVFVSAAGKLVSIFQPPGLMDSFGNPATQRHPGGRVHQWGWVPAFTRRQNFLAMSERHISF